MLETCSQWVVHATPHQHWQRTCTETHGPRNGPVTCSSTVTTIWQSTHGQLWESLVNSHCKWKVSSNISDFLGIPVAMLDCQTVSIRHELGSDMKNDPNKCMYIYIYDILSIILRCFDRTMMLCGLWLPSSAPWPLSGHLPRKNLASEAIENYALYSENMAAELFRQETMSWFP